MTTHPKTRHPKKGSLTPRAKYSRLNNVEQRVSAFRVSSLAIAISLAVGYSNTAFADSVPNKGKVRLALSDFITSEPEAKSRPSFDGRLDLHSLIQSDPSPLFALLEARYARIPSIDQAVEEVPDETMLAQDDSGFEFLQRVKNLATSVGKFEANVSTSLRYDKSSITSAAFGDTTLLAIVNPQIRHTIDTRKWQLETSYNYARGEYLSDSREAFNDHALDVNWTYKLDRGRDFTVSTLLSSSHEQSTSDPIEDFDSQSKSQDISYKRGLVNIGYRNGTDRDRTRYEVFLLNEHSLVDAGGLGDNENDYARTGFGASYTWQAKRQLALVADGRFQDFNYDAEGKDYTLSTAMIGTDFLFSRRMKASFRAGVESRKYSEYTEGSNSTNPVWQASFAWAVRRSSSVAIEAGRQVYQQLGDASRTQTATTQNEEDQSVQNWMKASWKETWSDRLNTQTSLAYRDTRGDQENGDRQGLQLLLSALYRLSANVTMGLDAAYTQEKSALGQDLIRKTFTLRTDIAL